MTTPIEPMADVRDMYMVHTMFRREFGLIPRLIRDVAEGDRRRAEIVGAHIDLLCRFLRVHHEGEDIILWPLLHERGGREADAIVATMGAQHILIETSVGQVTKVLPSWRATARAGAALAAAFDNLFPVLTEHMATEEKNVLPLAEKYVTASEWKRLSQHAMEAFSKKELALYFGLVMYETDPDVIKDVLEDAPLPVRLLIPHIAPRVFASHSRRVHGTPTPPRAGGSSLN